MMAPIREVIWLSDTIISISDDPEFGDNRLSFGSPHLAPFCSRCHSVSYQEVLALPALLTYTIVER